MERLAINCRSIDKILGGGLEPGIVTCVFGEAGAGKTNFALQAAASATKFGKVVFIDTEGGFSPERFLQIADKKALAKIALLEPKDFREQELAIKAACELVRRDGCHLVALDSAVALYRLEMNDEVAIELNRKLAGQLSALLRLARECGVVVLITDQVYSDFATKKVRAVGGDVLWYIAKAVLRLEKLRGARRRATLLKHRSLPEKEAEFEIGARGLLSRSRLFRN